MFVMFVILVGVYFGLFIPAFDVAGILSILTWVFLHFFGDGLGQVEQPFSKGPRVFLYKDLKRVTNRFRDKLGRGGSGLVYKGILDDGTHVAVKRVERLINGEELEYKREISVIGRVKHAHIVRLLGYCHHTKDTGSTSFIVYNFLPNGSLKDWISPLANNQNNRYLSWKLRCGVAGDVAKALAKALQILHLDIKPDNVLLNDNFQAIVSNFVLSRLMIERHSRILTAIRGYMAPEWFTSHGILEKCDIFSYGLLIIDLCLGLGNDLLDDKRNHNDKGIRILGLLENVVHRKEKVLEVINKRLTGEGEADWKQARALVWVAQRCLREDPKKWPTMQWVVNMLLYSNTHSWNVQ